MSGRGKTTTNIGNIAILEAVEAIQNKLNTSLTPLNTLTVEIAKIKQDIKNLQQVNNETNMFVQQNNSGILKNLLSIENEICIIKEC